MAVEKAKETAKMIMQTMISLISSAFGLVVALAWNEAIKHWMESSLGKGEEPTSASLFTYAVAATLLGVFFVLFLAWMASKIGGEAAITREADL